MKKMKSKSLSVFIVLCLLLTGLFNTVVAEPISEGILNTEIADEHDGHSHVDSEPLKQEIRVEPTAEESLRIIDGPIGPPIDEPGSTPCYNHSWLYTDDYNGRHRKECTRCDAKETEYHTFKYGNFGSTHQKQCTKCSYSVYENHVADSVPIYSSSGDSGHTTDCKLCSGNILSSHNYSVIADIMREEHTYQCYQCGHTKIEDCVRSGNVYGIDPHRYDRCKICGGEIELECLHSNKRYFNSTKYDEYHTIYCEGCAQLLGHEQHSYKRVSTGDDNHKLYCTKCEKQKIVPHDFNYTSQDYNNHVKKCACGYSTTQSHTWDSANQQCTKCGQEACQHNNAVAINTNNKSYHSLECNDCDQSNVGNEPHVWKTIYILPKLPGLDPVKQYVCTKCNYKLSPGAIPM